MEPQPWTASSAGCMPALHLLISLPLREQSHPRSHRDQVGLLYLILELAYVRDWYSIRELIRDLGVTMLPDPAHAASVICHHSPC